MTNLAPLQYEPQYGRGVMLPMTNDVRSLSCDRASRSVQDPWFVISTYPQAEFQVFAALGSFRRHLPTIVDYRTLMRHGRPVLKDGKRQTEEVIRPFFPGYLFVQLDLADPSWAAINRTQGVKRLMCTTELRPIAVPAGVVEALMDEGRAGDGAIDRGSPRKFAPLARGQKVRVTIGDRDIDTVVHMTDQERVWVLLSLFGGREVPTEVEREKVRAV